MNERTTDRHAARVLADAGHVMRGRAMVAAVNFGWRRRVTVYGLRGCCRGEMEVRWYRMMG